LPPWKPVGGIPQVSVSPGPGQAAVWPCWSASCMWRLAWALLQTATQRQPPSAAGLATTPAPTAARLTTAATTARQQAKPPEDGSSFWRGGPGRLRECRLLEAGWRVLGVEGEARHNSEPPVHQGVHAAPSSWGARCCAAPGPPRAGRASPPPAIQPPRGAAVFGRQGAPCWAAPAAAFGPSLPRLPPTSPRPPCSCPVPGTHPPGASGTAPCARGVAPARVRVRSRRRPDQAGADVVDALSPELRRHPARRLDAASAAVVRCSGAVHAAAGWLRVVRRG
jgi:hypothetical protein